MTFRSFVFILAAVALLGEDQSASVVQGVVRNSQGQPVAAVQVQLTTSAGILSAVTDSDGTYRFRALRPGTYTLNAGETKAGPFVLGDHEVRKLDLTVGSAAAPQFFDEPTFIVAGVTDPAQRGGHGSDTVFRAAEGLTNETASLRTKAAAPGTRDEAEQHHALAEKQEQAGDALNAAREYQRAAETESSERNIFDWGVELLKHHAAEQAGEVFASGNRLHPRSTRMLLGL